ncbi:hypothetical protein PISMIDRAFT_313853 [Pisolithus microcarpus 441]|uniref:Uncharacterized protein n=1 Tax=Pisolithus microcarpus 441 TaxID=765257 RepID=A0A0C9ZN63_9AGAM|nr:hypothetical protein PISMIDRAFT_313853 [Pisolithus microcarpus 441]
MVRRCRHVSFICKTAQLQHAHPTVFELFLNCRGTGQTTRGHYEPIMTRLGLRSVMARVGLQIVVHSYNKL